MDNNPVLKGLSIAVKSFFSTIIPNEFFLLVEDIGGDKC